MCNRVSFMALVAGAWLYGCANGGLPPDREQKVLSDSIACAVAVTSSVASCVSACQPDPHAQACKDSCVAAFLADAGAAKTCVTILGPDFIKDPRIVTAINKGLDLGLAIYDASRPLPAAPSGEGASAVDR
jgi:hypothetical protein